MIVSASRSELLDWINNDYGHEYTKIEQCGDGAVYCEIFDSVYPGKISVAKVNFQPHQDYQILNNYKILQSGFNKVGLTREVPVDKLMRCKMGDNLEFLQWLCKLANDVETKGTGGGSTQSAMPVRTRTSQRPTRQSSVPSSNRTSMMARSNRSSLLHSNRNTVNTTTQSGYGAPKRRTSTGLSRNSGSTGTVRRRTMPGGMMSAGGTGTPQNRGYQQQQQAGNTARLREEMKQLQEQLDESAQTQENLETERNFYFNKLREIEIICQNLNEKAEEADGSADADADGQPLGISVNDLVKHIQEILYSTAEGFQVPEEENPSGQSSAAPLSPEPIPEGVPEGVPEELLDGVLPDEGNKENDLQMLDEETF